MKKIISLFLSLIMLVGVLLVCPVTVSAVGVDDLTFKLNDDGVSYSVVDCASDATGELIIPDEYEGLPVTRIGNQAFYLCTRITAVEIPDTVTYMGVSAFDNCYDLVSVKLSAGLKEISRYAFEDCESLKDIEIPEGVELIDSCAFRYCDSLEKVVIPDSVTKLGGYVFYSCNKLEQIEFSENLTLIGKYSFGYCNSLKKITLPKSVRTLKEAVFVGCEALKKISVAEENETFSSEDGVLFNKDKTALIQYPLGSARTKYKIPDSVTTIKESAFDSNNKLVSIEFSKKLKNIEAYAFYMCDALTEIILPDSITVIGKQAFDSCSSLKSVKLPKNLKSLYIYTFGDCKSLEKVTFSKGLKSIGKKAFKGCTSLTSVNVPDGVKYIRDEAFAGCKKLKNITLPDSVNSIGEEAFYNTAYYKNKSNWEKDILYIGNHIIEAKTSLNSPFKIKEGTKTIADGAFRNCKKITGVNLPKGLVTIGDKAFYGCSNLYSIDIPDSVKYLGAQAFRECYYLGAVNIGDRVKEIGYMCFYYCPRISMVSLGKGLKVIGASAFYNCDNITFIDLPDGLQSIGDHAFYDCDDLNSFYIPDSVTYVGEDSMGYYVTCDEGEEIVYSDFEIYGRKGSAAEKYAEDVGLEFIKHVTHKKADKSKVKKPTVHKAGYKYTKCTICGTELDTVITPQKRCSKPKIKDVEKFKGGVQISWSKVDGGDYYRVYRKSTKNGEWKYINTVTSDMSYYNDRTVKSGKTYYYTVRAKNEAGLSDYNRTGVSVKY